MKANREGRPERVIVIATLVRLYHAPVIAKVYDTHLARSVGSLTFSLHGQRRPGCRAVLPCEGSSYSRLSVSSSQALLVPAQLSLWELLLREAMILPGAIRRVFIIIKTDDYALISSEYGNVDEGVPQRFIRCAQPAVDGDNETDGEWECDQKGKAPPFSFTVAAHETDGHVAFTNDCYTDQVYRGADGRYTDLYPPDHRFCTEEREDELIAKAKVDFKLEDLAELTAPGQALDRSAGLIGGCDSTEGPCSSGGAPHYILTYQVRRVPDATGGLPVDPNP